jgi:hypothetical protein
MIRLTPCSPFVASIVRAPWVQQIERWIRIVKNDVVRLQRFEKDDFVLVLGAIHGLQANAEGGPGTKVLSFRIPLADSSQPDPAIGDGPLGPGRDGIREDVETHRSRGEVRF